MNRRVRRALPATAATLGIFLAACDPGVIGVPGGEGDGTFEKPYTATSPGDNPAVSFPVLYAAKADGNASRLWVEVLDPGTNQLHPQNQDDYVKQIVIRDEFANDIAAQSFRVDSQARLIATVDIPEGIQTLYVYQLSSRTGWWLATYERAVADAAPIGDFRRPYTAAQPGGFAQQAELSLPVFGIRPNGQYTVEVGNRAADKLHPMEPNRYIDFIIVLDQFHQIRYRANLTPNFNPEPVVDFNPIGGTEYLRVLAHSTTYGWWESLYRVTP